MFYRFHHEMKDIDLMAKEFKYRDSCCMELTLKTKKSPSFSRNEKMHHNTLSLLNV